MFFLLSISAQLLYDKPNICTLDTCNYTQLITVLFSYKSKVLQDNYKWLEASEKKSTKLADISKASTNLPSAAWVKGAFHTQSQ